MYVRYEASESSEFKSKKIFVTYVYLCCCAKVYVLLLFCESGGYLSAVNKGDLTSFNSLAALLFFSILQMAPSLYVLCQQ